MRSREASHRLLDGIEKRASMAPPLRLLFLAMCALTAGRACILSTDSWTPLSLAERAKKADVVISAFARNTYKQERTVEDTYTAEFRLVQAFKGLSRLAAVKPDAVERNAAKVYNISNFGEKSMCYSNVVAGQTYILFLTTTVDGRLTAKYDDLFGSASEWSAHNVDMVLKGVGWGSWTDWSPCSKSCGEGGVQERRRKCTRGKGCDDGFEKVRRPCNTIKCKGTRDLLKIFNFARHRRRGVRPLLDREGAFRIDKSSHLRLPSYTLFPFLKYFPSDFAILATVRKSEPSGKSNASVQGGNFLGITDGNGRRRLAMRLGSTMEFTYLNAPGHQTLRQKPSYFRVNASIMDFQWHTVGVALMRNNLHFYVDCQLHSSFPFHRAYAGNDIPLASMMTIGYLPNSLKELNFEGDIEQLLITTDAKDAEHHCGEAKTIPDSESERLVMDASYDLPEGSGDKINTDHGSGNGQFEVEWSTWSSCSATCGRGIRKRTSYCLDNGYNLEECIENRMEKSETDICELKSCPTPVDRVIEKRPEKPKPKNNTSIQEPIANGCDKCLNGAACVNKKKCLCLPGFYGNRCEHVRATCPACFNGGKCFKSNVCTCPQGYTGSRCQEVVCTLPCQNGGRCIAPQRCSCPSGYAPPNCIPICNPACYNGGVCVAPSKCKCAKGYSGAFCQTAVCRKGCKNGGRCVSPEKCACPSGYTGQECETPICPPSCQNGGVCIKPYTCLCKSGFSGVYCEKFVCSPLCNNGGSCIGPDKCSCPPYYTGYECETAICKEGCSNGGKCVSPSKCLCPNGFYGAKCEKRNCKKYKPVSEPYQRSFKRKVQETFKEACGVLNWKTCTKFKVHYETVQKTFYRTTYKCLD